MGDLSSSNEAKKRETRKEGGACWRRGPEPDEREREYTWVDVLVVLDSGDGGGRRTWWWRNAVSSFFLFQWRESVRRGARRGALGVPPAACGTNVGCVFWVAESGGAACAGGGTRRGESGRSNQHKEERVRVEEENTHDCVRCCDCELCEGGVHLLSPV